MSAATSSTPKSSAELLDPHSFLSIESSLEQTRLALVSIYQRQMQESELAGVKHGTHGREGRAELLKSVSQKSIGPFDVISSSHADDLIDFITTEQHHEEKLLNDNEVAINCSFSLRNLGQLHGSGLVMPIVLMTSMVRDHQSQQTPHEQVSASEQSLHDAEPPVRIDEIQQELSEQTSVESREQLIISKYKDLNCLAPISYLPAAFDYDAHSRTSLLPALRILLPLATSLISARAVWLPNNSFSLGPGVSIPWHTTSWMIPSGHTAAGYSVHPFLMRWPRNRAEMLSAIRQLHTNLSENESDLEPFLLANASSDPEEEDLRYHPRLTKRNAHRQGLLTLQEAEIFLNHELENEQLATLSQKQYHLDSSSIEMKDPPASEEECSCLLENEASIAAGSASGSCKKQRCPSSHYVSCSDECYPCQNSIPVLSGSACCLDHLQLLRGCMWWRCGQSVHLIRLLIERQMRIVETHWQQSPATNYPGSIGTLYDLTDQRKFNHTRNSVSLLHRLLLLLFMLVCEISEMVDWSTIFAVATLPDPILAPSISPPSPRTGAAPRTPQPPPCDQYPHLAALPDTIISKLQHALPWPVDILVGARSAIRPLPSLVVAPLSDGWIGGFVGASSPIF